MSFTQEASGLNFLFNSFFSEQILSCTGRALIVICITEGILHFVFSFCSFCCASWRLENYYKIQKFDARIQFVKKYDVSNIFYYEHNISIRKLMKIFTFWFTK